MPGIVTAVLLAVGRGIGDAATVLFTAGYTDNIPHALEPAGSNPSPIHILSAGKPGGRSTEQGLCLGSHLNRHHSDIEFFSPVFQFEILKTQDLIMKDIYIETMKERSIYRPHSGTTCSTCYFSLLPSGLKI